MLAIRTLTLIVHPKADEPVPIDTTARGTRTFPGLQLIGYDGYRRGFGAANADQTIADTRAFVLKRSAPASQRPILP